MNHRQTYQNTTHQVVWVLCQILHSGRDTRNVYILFVYSLNKNTLQLPLNHMVFGGYVWCVCLGQLVPVAFTPYSASKSGLSTP